MPNPIFDGLSLVDATGRAILVAILVSLGASAVVTLRVRARYRALKADLDENTAPHRRFLHDVLNLIVDDAREAARFGDASAQAIVERRFHSELRPLLLGERFVRASTGLVIILGLMGTFYGLTLSIGKLVHLVAGDVASSGDVGQAVTTGLTSALSGMTVAFSNSLFGIASAVILTLLGVFASLADRRTARLLQLETHVDRLLATGGPANRRAPVTVNGEADAFGRSIERLEGAVEKFEAALSLFATSTRDFTEFNAHLKDNVQRMSLCFGDLSDTLRTEVRALKRGAGGAGE